ncbi:DNA polymerase III subunit alpha [Echinicola strongylocentroti]|uniref:DNA-directed DNA polymerase n=1 Tax=Echinicola strongylocentroti TaxID=1795355 RepID=A0A2Z4ILU1_9BACT|nr:PHP domain-containing protein [Echinicola strongylocentroti]AWW31690.1 DNA polymerase III subunit alpha [Echinicola strongylocentroti]
MYINCHSHFSFRYGTLSVQELVEQARAKGVRCLALTDINCTAAVYPFIKAAKSAGMHPVIGIDFRNGIQQQYIGLARNHHGFWEMNKHLSYHKRKKTAIPEKAPEWQHTAVIYPFGQTYFELQSHEYIGIHPYQIKKALRSSWAAQKHRWVLLQPATFHSQQSFNIHRLLRCIELNTLLSKLPTSEQADLSDRFYSTLELTERCDQQYWLLQQTQELLASCHFDHEYRKVENKASLFGSSQADVNRLHLLAYKGARQRYGKVLSPTQEARIQKELDIIQQKNFVSYFLINHEIITYARREGFYYVGRGSGANSMVAYCLYITDVDPIELDLYFERFINLYRSSPPDFDIDFSWRDRDHVIEHIFNEYNTDRHEHVCLLATHNTFQINSSIRELGKVFGLPKTDIEALINHVSKPGNYIPDRIGQLVLKYSHLLQGMPSHLSIHAGGILISQHPIHYYTATDLPPKGYPISHFDMVTAEEIGFAKFDILSQRGLGHIRDSLAIIQKNQGKHIDIHRIADFKKDTKVKEHLRRGHTIGAFYVESPAMRMLLAKLKVDEYLGLVAASSIIRPGVARSGMMREYILRHRTPDLRKSRAHPILYDLMPETYGIMVYQEDVIKVAHYYAGLSFDEADVLRRGMSGKFRSREEFTKVKASFFKKSLNKGRDKKTTNEVWYQIESFAGYSFAKGHSASFAVESYQSLYLKAHFPLEFMVGVINNFGGFYKTEFYIRELQSYNADVQLPHINESEQLTSIKGTTVYLGFIHLKYLQKEITNSILHNRTLEGPFSDLRDFINRVSISLEQLLILIRIEAFRFTSKTKQALLWEAHFITNKRKNKTSTNHLFRQINLRELQVPQLETNDPRQDILDQLEIMEFPVDDPFLLLKEQHFPSQKAKDIGRFVGKEVQLLGYLVTVKYTRTVKGDVMNFGTFLDRDGLWIDTVHFPPIVKRFPLTGRGIYLLKGKITEEFDFYTLEITNCQKLAYWNAADDQPSSSTTLTPINRVKQT